MYVIVELDGIFLNQKPGYWHAYGVAAGKTGLARTDEVTFWRLIRTGAETGQLIRGARDRHIEIFRETFNNSIESDEIIAAAPPQDELESTINYLHELGQCHLVTSGTNLTARKNWLKTNGLDKRFPEISQIPMPTPVGAALLSQIASEHSPAFVLGTSEHIIKCAEQTNIRSVGIAAGGTIMKRLAASGAAACYPNVEAFKEAKETADEPLKKIGLIPAGRSTGRDRDDKPTNHKPTGKKPIDRPAQREARRQQRMSRRKIN